MQSTETVSRKVFMVNGPKLSTAGHKECMYRCVSGSRGQLRRTWCAKTYFFGQRERLSSRLITWSDLVKKQSRSCKVTVMDLKRKRMEHGSNNWG